MDILLRDADMRRLVIFEFNRMSDALAKGNIWHPRHFERRFDRVFICYLRGGGPRKEEQGKTTIMSLGSGFAFAKVDLFVDLLLAPWRLYRLARGVKATAFLSHDVVFSWWTSWAVRRLRGAKVIIVPACTPPEIYANAKHSLSGLPIPLEKFFTTLCFRASRKIVIPEKADMALSWLLPDSNAAPKLLLTPVVVNEFPPQAFLDGITPSDRETLHTPPTLLYVGRLHHEKFVIDLVRMLAELARMKIDARLLIAGEGDEKSRMISLADELGVADRIEWLGCVDASELPSVYARADIFVSTLTGTSLREAGLTRLPVVAYSMDWVKLVLRHEETALMARPRDAVDLAAQVARMIRDDALRRRCADAFHAYANTRWSPDKIGPALDQIFSE